MRRPPWSSGSAQMRRWPTSSSCARRPRSRHGRCLGQRPSTPPAVMRALKRALRSGRHPQRRTRARSESSGFATESRPPCADRQVRALRLLSADLSDLHAVGRGDGLAARAHLSDEGRRRGADADRRAVRPALRRLSRLHGVRDRVSVRRAVRRRSSSDARADRAASTERPALDRPVPRARCWRWSRIPGACVCAAAAAACSAACSGRWSARQAAGPTTRRRRAAPDLRHALSTGCAPRSHCRRR